MQTPQKKRKTCKEFKDSLRKMSRKVTGTKDELKDRLAEVLNSNDRGWSGKRSHEAGSWTYLDSGAHRDVYKGIYSKGPRKGQFCVDKRFKSGSVYASSGFSHDVAATQEAAPIIAAFNRRIPDVVVTLNEPEVWTALTPDSSGKKSKSLIEPFIQGSYRKFNSNTGYADEGHAVMQALSHFSYHRSHGKMVLCDLQGGCYSGFYVLTDPVICSEDKKFGVTDLGKAGMENWFHHHRCNHLCNSGWRKPFRPTKHYHAVPGTTFFRR